MQQIVALTARIAALEARLEGPAKTPDNSSVPPSQGQKADLPAGRRKRRRRGHAGVARALAEHPDRIVTATLPACPHCAHALGPADLPDVHAYDHIDLPPIRPIVTRIHRHRGVCPCCRRPVTAPAPAGFDPGSPFGAGIIALVLHLHVTQAVGFERLARLMHEVFGLTISEGAIANLLDRAKAPLLAAMVPIAAAVRASAVVGCDETSARVCGKTWWQWVLLSGTAICHVIADTRGAAAVTHFLHTARAEVWVADRYGGQQGHGAMRQMCLAHLLHDATYAAEAGDTGFAPGFRRLLCQAVAIGKRRDRLKDTTLAHAARPSTAGWTSSCPRLRRSRRRPAVCSTPCGVIATTCSASSPAATCPTPTMPARGRCARP